MTNEEQAREFLEIVSKGYPATNEYEECRGYNHIKENFTSKVFKEYKRYVNTVIGIDDTMQTTIYNCYNTILKKGITVKNKKCYLNYFYFSLRINLMNYNNMFFSKGENAFDYLYLKSDSLDDNEAFKQAIKEERDINTDTKRNDILEFVKSNFTNKDYQIFLLYMQNKDAEKKYRRSNTQLAKDLHTNIKYFNKSLNSSLSLIKKNWDKFKLFDDSF